MPDPRPVDPAPILARASTLASESLRQLAADAGVSDFTVRRALARFAPVHETLSQIKRDEMTAAWQTVAIKSVAAMDQFLDGEAPIPVGPKSSVSGTIRDLAVAAGIASEKALLFAGQPTAITQVTSDLRAQLPTVLERLARVLQARQAGLGPGDTAQPEGIATARDVTPGQSARSEEA